MYFSHMSINKTHVFLTSYDAPKRQLGPRTRLGTEPPPKRFPSVSLAISGFPCRFQEVSKPLSWWNRWWISINLPSTQAFTVWKWKVCMKKMVMYYRREKEQINKSIKLSGRLHVGWNNQLFRNSWKQIVV